MGWWIARESDQIATTTLKRFDPRYWTVNFPRPMMASVITIGAHSLRVDAIFYCKADLAGLIWESADTHDHPMLRYATHRDYRRCLWRFRWRSSGLLPLDAINGPTLTIEGRDAGGAPRTWYIRLWNYAQGTPQDAIITLDFAALNGGFTLPGEADPVWAGDIDRLFLSLTPPGYVAEDESPLPTPVESWLELSDMACDGSGSVLSVGDITVPPHGYGVATGYDDLYHLTPARVLHNIVRLGYRGAINHYVGMSHCFRLKAAGGDWLVDEAAAPLNLSTQQWHQDLAGRLANYDMGLILSLSYELLDQHCPDGWKQRAENGDPGLTGWSPPSALLSPANDAAMAYLHAVARGFVTMAQTADLPVRFQIGEPWWWVMPDSRPCLYDAEAVAAFGGAPVSIPSVRDPLTASQKALLDQAGALLAASTLALRDAVLDDAPDAETLLLAYLPTIMDAQAPDLIRANMPTGWAVPAFDILQLEAYDWVTQDRVAEHRLAVAQAQLRLGYPPSQQHYLSGFALLPDDGLEWGRIIARAVEAKARGVAEVYLWALPQILRDGLIFFADGGAAMQAFDDVAFPIAIGREALVEPAFSTAIVTMASGHEQRNSDWANARLRFDAGPGVRSEADVESILHFFRARRGPARAFRFRDPFDHSSAPLGSAPQVTDQMIGTGDGVGSVFPLIKSYGEEGEEPQIRRITRPVAASLLVAVNGALASGWVLEEGGAIRFTVPPAEGAVISAGYLYDVPVRFEGDQLSISRATWAAGEIASVPLIEVRDASL